MISNEFNPLRALGIGTPLLVAWNFTTDIYGDETLVQDHNGQITCARSTNTYVFTISEAGDPATWDVTDAVFVSHDQEKAINCAWSTDPTAGTVTLAFDTDLDSAEVSVVLYGRDNT